MCSRMTVANFQLPSDAKVRHTALTEEAHHRSALAQNLQVLFFANVAEEPKAAEQSKQKRSTSDSRYFLAAFADLCPR